MRKMNFCKLEIFIPETHFEILQETLTKCDAGHIGKYDSCISYYRVKGTWRPLEGSKPYQGTEGLLSVEDELKVEITCRIESLDDIIEAVKKIHPYEEPVINAIPIIRTGL